MSFEKLKQHSSDNLGSGTSEETIKLLEESLSIELPQEFRTYLKEIGYSEIYGDQIYSIYSVPDTIPCSGLHWMNSLNEDLSNGFIEFFSNDIDGVFYLKEKTGEVYLNSTTDLYAQTFTAFISKLLET